MSWISSIFRPFHTAAQLKAMRRYATETETYIKSLEQQVGTLREQIKTLDDANDRLNDAYRAACDQRDQLTGQLSNAQQEISKLRSKVALAQKDLNTLDEINTMVERFVEEREKYRKRIAGLKDALADARAQMRRMLPKDDDAEVDSISFAKGMEIRPIDHNRPSQPAAGGKDNDESDWLMDLPD